MPRRQALALSSLLVWVLCLACDGVGEAVVRPPASRLEVEEHIQRGMELMRQGQEENALAEFRQSTSLDPNNARATLQLGRVLAAHARRTNQLPFEAAEVLKKAVKLDPKSVQARFELSQVLLKREVGLYEPERVIDLIEGILRDSPAETGIRLRYATWLIMSEVRLSVPGKEGKVTKDSSWTLDVARFNLERVIDEAPADSEMAAAAHLMMADVLMKLGCWPEALQEAKLFMARYPNVPLERGTQALSILAQSQMRLGLYNEAIETYRRWHDLEPSDRPLWGIFQCMRALGGYPAGLPQKYRFPLRPERHEKDQPPPPRFRNIAHELGIEKTAGAGPAGWADYDGDGRYDLVACGMDTFCSLFHNEGKRFRDVTLQAGMGNVESGFGTAWGDYDGDGRPDLYIARNGWGGPLADSLLHNQGDGTFEDVTKQAGIDEPGSGFHVTWFDYNRDGWLDVFVSNGVTYDLNINHLYRNNGNGTFTNVTEEAGLGEKPSGGTIGVAVGDYDQNGWPDLFIHGRMVPNRLYHNLGNGKFEEVAKQAGVAGNGRQNGYVALFQDMDSDGDLDIVTVCLAPWEQTLAGMRADYVPVANDDLVRLYRNEVNGHFTDVSEKAGFVYPIGIMAAGTADVDNDGYSDLYFGTGNPDLRRQEPNLLYQNTGNGAFVDVSRAAGVWEQGKGPGISFFDWNGDGYLEIFAEKGGFYHGDLYASAFFLNETPHGNHYLFIDLLEDGPNRFAVGTGVTVQAGPLKIYKEVTSGRGFGSTDPYTLHFGLGKHPRIDLLRVRWPDGTSSDYPAPSVDSRIRIRKGESGWTLATTP